MDTLLEFYQLLLQLAETQFFYVADPAILMQIIDTLLEFILSTYTNGLKTEL